MRFRRRTLAGVTNLVISKSCSIASVRNIIDQLLNCCRFFLNSQKRSGLLEHIVQENVADTQAYVFIVESLQLINCRQHLEKSGDDYAWDTKNWSKAQQFLAAITSFNFIVCFTSLYHYLYHLAGITVKLQKSIDILEAHEMIHEVTDTYKEERKDVKSNFKKVFEQSACMAKEVGSQPEMPRIASRQEHRSNSLATSVVLYWTTHSQLLRG